MIIPRIKLFSRHTPKNLREYKRNSDEDIDNMSRGQRLRALEEEDETAAHNTQKYANKKIKKHAGIGAVGGAAIGAAMGAAGTPGARKAGAALGALYGGLSGGAVGLVSGDYRGRKKAKEEGHDRDDRTKKLARRIDDRARAKGQEDDYEYQNNSRIRQRKTEEMAQAAYQQAAMANYNASGARWGY